MHPGANRLAIHPLINAGEIEQWIDDIGAKWDERLIRLKTWLEHEQTD
jgi:hypothetical protein